MNGTYKSNCQKCLALRRLFS